MVLLFALTILFYYHSERLIDLQPGLIICRSDCNDFHNLSDYLLQQGRFAPTGGDYHTSPFYWIYIAYVGAIKALFGTYWHLSYVILSTLYLYGFIAWSATALRRRETVGPALNFIIFALVVTNLQLLIYARTLLTDFLFALVAAVFFALLACGLANGRNRLVAAAIMIALASALLRPSGTFLVCLAIAVIVVRLMPIGRSVWAVAAAPVVAGLAVWIFSAAVTSYAVDNLDNLDRFSPTVRSNLEQFIEFGLPPISGPALKLEFGAG